jgi:2-amino-4-hydroxy-6-hydroxymethyldihydropteridine diphosphokinase
LSDHLYLIALGSNQRHGLIGSPEKIVEQAIVALETGEIDVFAVSSIINSIALGPSSRRFANAAAIIATHLPPPDLLEQLQAIETHFGRNKRGQRWQARTLDLDIILWSGGIWISDHPPLAIPHMQLRKRSFVLAPANEIAPGWREPLTGLSIRQLFHRLNRPKPLDHSEKRL